MLILILIFSFQTFDVCGLAIIKKRDLWGSQIWLQVRQERKVEKV
jgi:hypothetical protein